MGKLKRELEFLDREMQRVETELQKLQQDPTLTPFVSMVGIWPKQYVDQHDYHVMKQSKVKGTYDHDRYIGPYSTTEQQIRANAMLLRQIYKEEQKQFEEQIKQVEKVNKYYLNQMRDQVIPNQSNFVIKEEKTHQHSLEFLSD